MYSIAQNLPAGMQLALLLVSLVLVFGLLLTVTLVWGRVRRLQIEYDLKSDMLERGLSASEIREVLGTPMRGKRHHEIQAELTAKLAEIGLDGSQIKQILKAASWY